MTVEFDPWDQIDQTLPELVPEAPQASRDYFHVSTGNLARLDARLEGRDWLTGQRSIADPYLYVMLRWAFHLEIGLYGFANLIRFAEPMYQDAGIRAAIIAEEDDITPWWSELVSYGENMARTTYRKAS